MEHPNASIKTTPPSNLNLRTTNWKGLVTFFIFVSLHFFDKFSIFPSLAPTKEDEGRKRKKKKKNEERRKKRKPEKNQGKKKKNPKMTQQPLSSVHETTTINSVPLHRKLRFFFFFSFFPSCGWHDMKTITRVARIPFPMDLHRSVSCATDKL